MIYSEHSHQKILGICNTIYISALSAIQRTRWYNNLNTQGMLLALCLSQEEAQAGKFFLPSAHWVGQFIS